MVLIHILNIDYRLHMELSTTITFSSIQERVHKGDHFIIFCFTFLHIQSFLHICLVLKTTCSQ